MSRVFITWSGERSKKVAEALREWLPTIIQAAEPFMSSWDIGAGSDWLSVIRGKLDEAKVGIICVTRENLEEKSPWLLFEAGALAKHLGSPVCLLLLDLNPSGVSPPLSIFQASCADREGITDILKTINGTIKQPLTEETLSTMIDRGWPVLEEQIKAIKKDDPPGATEPVRGDRELLEEILTRVRNLNKRAMVQPQSYRASVLARKRMLDLEMAKCSNRFSARNEDLPPEVVDAWVRWKHLIKGEAPLGKLDIVGVELRELLKEAGHLRPPEDADDPELE